MYTQTYLYIHIYICEYHTFKNDLTEDAQTEKWSSAAGPRAHMRQKQQRAHTSSSKNTQRRAQPNPLPKTIRSPG